MTTQAQALSLLALGLSVIPVPVPGPGCDGKTPALRWKDYQRIRPTQQEVQAWFARPQNVAVITGAVSGVVVVDTDNAEAEAWAQEHLPETSWSVRTAKGVHRYYRHPGRPVKNKIRAEGLALDLRGDGGFVIGPWSLHESGSTYEPSPAFGQGRVEDLPVLPEDLVAAPAPAPPAAVLPFRPTEGREQTIRRARLYLEATPGAVQGQGGDDATFRAACKVLRGFGLSEDEAYPLLAEWNQKCTPPWSERDLRAKLRNAAKYGTEPAGERAAAPLPPQPQVRIGGRVLGHGATVADAARQEAPARLRERASVTDFWMESSEELLGEEDRPRVYLVNQLIPENTLALIHGEPRARKSWFALELAVAMATGTPAFGMDRFSVPRAVPVCYSTQEDSRDLVRRRLRRLLAARGLEKAPNLYLSIHKGIDLDNVEWPERIAQGLLAEGIRQFFVDPARRYSANADKGPTEVRAITRVFQQIAEYASCGTGIVHHDVKPQLIADTRRRAHRAAGGDWFAACQAPIHLEPAGRNKTLVVPNSYKDDGGDPDPFVFEIQGKPSDPAIRLVGSDSTVEAASLSVVEDQILGYLKAHPLASGYLIRRGISGKSAVVVEALDRMEMAGRIHSVPGPRNGKLWAVAEEEK